MRVDRSVVSVLIACVCTSHNVWSEASATGGGSHNPGSYGYPSYPVQQQQQQHESHYHGWNQPQGHTQPSLEGQLPPLPPGWSEHFDPTTGQPYYYNAADGTTTWDRPAPEPASVSAEKAIEEKETNEPAIAAEEVQKDSVFSQELSQQQQQQPDADTNAEIDEHAVSSSSQPDQQDDNETSKPTEGVKQEDSWTVESPERVEAARETLQQPQQQQQQQQQQSPWGMPRGETQQGAAVNARPPAGWGLKEFPGQTVPDALQPGTPVAFDNLPSQDRQPQQPDVRSQFPHQQQNEPVGRTDQQGSVPDPRYGPPGRPGAMPDLHYGRQEQQQGPTNDFRRGPPEQSMTPGPQQGWPMPDTRLPAQQVPQQSKPISPMHGQNIQGYRQPQQGMPQRAQQPPVMRDEDKGKPEVMAPWDSRPQYQPQTQSPPERQPIPMGSPQQQHQPPPKQVLPDPTHPEGLRPGYPPAHQQQLPPYARQNAPNATHPEGHKPGYGAPWGEQPGRQGPPTRGQVPPQGFQRRPVPVARGPPGPGGPAQQLPHGPPRQAVPLSPTGQNNTPALQPGQSGPGQPLQPPPSAQGRQPPPSGHGAYGAYGQYQAPPGSPYNQYGQYGSYPQQGYGQQQQQQGTSGSSSQLVSQEETVGTALRGALGSAWQGLLGFGSKTKEAVDSAKNTVVAGAREATQSLSSTSTSLLAQAKNTLGSVFEPSSDEAEQYSLTGRYGTPPAPPAGTQGYPPQTYQQQQGYAQQQQPPQRPPGQGYPPQVQYPPGYGPPQPRVDPAYPHQAQQQPQAPRPGQQQRPMQSQWQPGQPGYPGPQNYDPRRGPYGPPQQAGYPPRGPPPQRQQLPPQQQRQGPPPTNPAAQQQRPPNESTGETDAWMHPGLSGF